VRTANLLLAHIEAGQAYATASSLMVRVTCLKHTSASVHVQTLLFTTPLPRPYPCTLFSSTEIPARDWARNVTSPPFVLTFRECIRARGSLGAARPVQTSVVGDANKIHYLAARIPTFGPAGNDRTGPTLRFFGGNDLV